MILFFLIFIFLTHLSFAQTPDVSDILRVTEAKVSALDSMSRSLSGEFLRKVEFKSSAVGRSGEGQLAYLINVEGGKQQSCKRISEGSVSDSSIIVIMDKALTERNDKPILEVYNTAFPWVRYISKNESNNQFSAHLLSNSTDYFGKKCYLIEFDLKVKNDSLSVDGNGKLWIGLSDHLPVRLESDMNFDSKKGKGRTKAFIDFSFLQPGFLVVTRSEFQTFPRFLFVPMGSFKVVIEQKDFKLEYEK